MGEANERESQLAELSARLAVMGGKVEGLVREGGDHVEKTMVLRYEFFEKLVVLDGGTIALSVSLLGNIASHHALQLIHLLAVSWILLILGMAFGMSRSWFFQEERRAATELYVGRTLDALVPWAEFAAVLKEESPERMEFSTLTRQQVIKHARLDTILSWCGRMCIVSTLGGYSFLIWFAVRNL
jgi:hypothetical protein